MSIETLIKNTKAAPSDEAIKVGLSIFGVTAEIGTVVDLKELIERLERFENTFKDYEWNATGTGMLLKEN